MRSRALYVPAMWTCRQDVVSSSVADHRLIAWQICRNFQLPSAGSTFSGQLSICMVWAWPGWVIISLQTDGVCTIQMQGEHDQQLGTGYTGRARITTVTHCASPTEVPSRSAWQSTLATGTGNGRACQNVRAARPPPNPGQ